MRVATWNLQRPASNAAPRARRLQAALQDLRADIWVLTETRTGLSPRDNFHGVHTTGYDRPGRPDECWASIWSTYPVEPLASVGDPVRSAHALVTPPVGPQLVVCATVLPWLGSPWRDVPTAGGAAFQAALDAQANDWRSLRSAFPQADLLVAGDFNQDLADTPYYGSKANRQILMSRLREVGLVPLTAGADDPVRRCSPPYACIDHICLSTGSHWRPLATGRWPDARKPDERFSDHFAILVDFEYA